MPGPIEGPKRLGGPGIAGDVDSTPRAPAQSTPSSPEHHCEPARRERLVGIRLDAASEGDGTT